MTSNLAIARTADISTQPTQTDDLLKSITPTTTGRGTLTAARRPAAAGTTGTGTTGADAGMKLAAGGIVPRGRSPGAQIETWKNTIQERVAPKAKQPAGFDRSPVIDRPTGGSKTPGAAATIFSPGSRKITVPGLPTLTRPVEKSVLANLNESLTGARVAKFNQLNPGQQKVLRAMLEAALEGMGKPAGDPSRIDPKHMGALIDLMLKDAKSMRVADEVPAGARNRGPIKPPKVAVEVEPKRPAAPIVRAEQPVAPTAQAVVPVAPTAQAVEPVTPVTPPVAAAETTPTTPTTGTGAITPATPTTPTAPTTPTPPSSAQPAVAWPFPGETAPAWFAPAIAYDPNPQSPTYQPDRDMGRKVVALVVDSREFAGQASSILVTRELTSRWNAWKIA